MLFLVLLPFLPWWKRLRVAEMPVVVCRPPSLNLGVAMKPVAGVGWEYACLDVGGRAATVPIAEASDDLQLLFACLGPHGRAWVKGYTKASSCLALEVGATPSAGGSIRVVPCNTELPSLCQLSSQIIIIHHDDGPRSGTIPDWVVVGLLAVQGIDDIPIIFSGSRVD